MGTAYSARFDTADLAQQARNELVSCRVYRAGSLVAPTEAGSTVSIYAASGIAVVTAAPVTVTTDVATYTLLGTVTDDLALSRDWRVEWRLLMPDGVVHTFDNRMVLCRRVPFPVITEGSLYGRVRALDPADPANISRRTEYSSTIDDGWIQLVNRLVESGKRIELVTDPSVYREVHLTLTLAMVFDDLAVRNPAHAEAAKSFRAQYETAWGRLALPTDTDDNGTADIVAPARGPVWLM